MIHFEDKMDELIWDLVIRDCPPDTREEIEGKLRDPFLALFDEDEYVRELAGQIIIKMEKLGIAEPITSLLKNKDGFLLEESEMAKALMEKINNSSATETLIPVLKSEDEYVRDTASTILFEIGDIPALEALIATLEYENEFVSSKAISASCKLEGSRAVERFVKALNDKSSKLHVFAIFALDTIEHLGYFNTIGHLIAALKNEDSEIRKRAAIALSRKSNRHAIRALMAALKDKNLEIIAAAYLFFLERHKPKTDIVLINALNEYGNEKMAMDFIKSGDPELKKAAGIWLKRIFGKDYF